MCVLNGALFSTRIRNAGVSSIQTSTYNAFEHSKNERARSPSDLISPLFNLGPRDRRPVRQLPYLPTPYHWRRMPASSPTCLRRCSWLIESACNSQLTANVSEHIGGVFPAIGIMLIIVGCVCVCWSRKFAGEFPVHLSTARRTTGLCCVPTDQECESIALFLVAQRIVRRRSYCTRAFIIIRYERDAFNHPCESVI